MRRKCKKPLVLLNSVVIFALEVLHTNKIVWLTIYAKRKAPAVMVGAFYID